MGLHGDGELHPIRSSKEHLPLSETQSRSHPDLPSKWPKDIYDWWSHFLAIPEADWLAQSKIKKSFTKLLLFSVYRRFKRQMLDTMNISSKLKFILSLLTGTLFFAACAGPIKGLPDDEKINPVVVYTEACNYNLRGMLTEYISPAAYSSLAARRREMPGLNGLCIETTSNIEPLLKKFGIKAIIKDINDTMPPPKSTRNNAANSIGAKYIIFIHKPLIDNYIQNNIYTPYVYTGIDIFDLTSDEAIGSGKVISGKVAIPKNGAMVATKIAETLRKRCSNKYFGCGTDGAIYMLER